MPRPPPVVPFIQTGNPEMDRLQRFVQQALPGKQDNWAAPRLLNSWAQDAGGISVGYFKDSVGIVRIRGIVKSGTIGQTIFILPIGCRPNSGTASLYFPVQSNGAYGQVKIDSSGNVTPTVGSATSFGLDGVAFDTR